MFRNSSSIHGKLLGIATAVVCASSPVAHSQVWLWTNYAGVPESEGSENTPGSLAKFYQPHGIALDPHGNAIIADLANHTIRKVTPDGVVTTLAGSTSAGHVDGNGTSARFSSPSGVAIDSSGNIYIADRGNHRIRKISPSGQVTTLAGQAVAGATDATGANAQFKSPSGVAVDRNGNVYVTDTGNHTIRRITPAGVVSTLAGVAGSSGYQNGTGATALFHSPEGIAFDSAGDIFITESGSHRIRKITLGGEVSLFAGSGVPGSAAGVGATAQFNTPTSIAFAPNGNMYVGDCSNHMVRVISPTGIVGNVAGLAGVEGVTEGLGTTARFNNPYGLAVDSQGVILVTDRDNAMLRKIALGNVTNFVGVPLGEGYLNSSPTPARFRSPRAVAGDGRGNLYVADSGNHTIRKISSGGVVSTIAGSAGISGSNDGMSSNARFFTPAGIATEWGNGEYINTLYVSDEGNSTIRKIGPDGQVITIAGSPGVHGSIDGYEGTLFRNPTGIDATPYLFGYLVIADTGNNTLRKFNLRTNEVTTMAGLAGNSGSVNGNASATRFRSPTGVAALYPDGVLVADMADHTVRRIYSSQNLSSPVAGSSLIPGTADGTGEMARFNQPTGIDSDSYSIVVTDKVNHTIRRMAVTNYNTPGTATTIGGMSGQPGVKSGIWKAGRFSSPQGVVIMNGDIYVADTANHRIVKGKAYAGPWEAWLAMYNITSGPNGDDDHNGVENLLEFAFGLDPRDGKVGKATGGEGTILTRGTPSISRNPNGSYSGYYIQRQDYYLAQLTYSSQFSSDLVNWTTHDGSITYSGIDDEMHIMKVNLPATLPNGESPRFFRVKVVRQ